MEQPRLAMLAAYWIGFCVTAGSIHAAAADDSPVDFTRDIRPILSNTCFKCHGFDEKQRQAGLRLDTQDGGTSPLKSGKRAVVPGKSAESALWARITAADANDRMPPESTGKKLTPAQIELLKKWIDQGAEWRDHWSFITPKRPEPPVAKNEAAVGNPIDRFVLARLEKEGLQLSPPTDKVTLIRRLAFDLTGLPATPAEVDAFVADGSPQAYERLADRLLSSPRYGEHMARYWLDAARYGDSHGLHFDNERSLWPYRDWVISAFNRNLPFDQFTVEQLAGDLIRNATREQQIATGFCRCNVSTSEGGSIDEEVLVRYGVDRVETTSTVFLGLTLGCAVCHDHKFDPIKQQEFYQLFAFFNNAADRAMDGNSLLPPPILKLPTPEQEARLKFIDEQIALGQRYIAEKLARTEYVEPEATGTSREVAALEPKDHVRIDDALSAVAKPQGDTARKFDSLLAWDTFERAQTKSTLPKPVQDAIKVDPAQRNDDQKKLIRSHFIEFVYPKTHWVFEPLHAQLDLLNKERTALDSSIPSTMVMADMPQGRETFVLLRGAYDKRGDKVTAGVPAAFPPMPKDAPMNRLGLAKWLVDPSHPLTARVTVNRFWQQFFGKGLVKTSNDFGSQGEMPTHPELLDWLATEFIQPSVALAGESAKEWDVKHIVRMIVTSSTYRQSSRVTPELLRRDPENSLLSRGPRFRMDAEVVRDSALASSGLLVERIGGRSVKPYQPPGLWEAVGFVGSNTSIFKRDEGDSLYRRSMYTFWKRTSPPPSLTTFDAPSRETCTVRRARTNTPLQALTLMNDEQYVEASRHLARRMIREGGVTPPERLSHAFRLATSRRPESRELDVLVTLYEQQLAFYRADKEAAVKLLSVGESKRDESLDPSDYAACTMMANLLLNLDETVTKE